jgi:BASS family bile acid:Na+ symporter
MDLKQIVVLALQVSIVATVFGFGLKAAPSDVWYVVKQPRLFVRSLLAVFVIMPFIAVVLVRAFDFRPTVEIALVSLALSPVPPLLPSKEAKAGGHAAFHAFIVGLTAWLGLVAIVAEPLMLRLLEWISGRPLAIAPTAIAMVVFKTVLVPLAAGIIVHRVSPSFADRAAVIAARVGRILLYPSALLLLIASMPAIMPLIGQGTLLAMVVFVASGLAIGHLLGGPDPDHAAVLALATASRHPALALTVAAANFPGERFIGAILLYVLVNAAIAIPYLTWQRHATEAAHPV